MSATPVGKSPARCISEFADVNKTPASVTVKCVELLCPLLTLFALLDTCPNKMLDICFDTCLRMPLLWQFLETCEAKCQVRGTGGALI